MATILKKFENHSKGIISFTHKEKKYIGNFISNFFLKKKFEEIKKTFFLSMHWGWFHENHKDIPYIDFHLAGKGTLSFKNKNNNYIFDLCNRNFIDKKFKVKKLNKIYDFISITRPVKFKNIDKLFKSFKKIYANKIYPRILIIFPIYSVNDFNKKDYYKNIFEDYKKIFSEEEKNYFTLMPLYSGELFPLSKEEICNYLNLSKIFVLPVEREGASRVIHEALLCGLPVITCKNLKGGGLDYLNDKNSLLIEDFEKMDKTLLQAIDKFENFKSNELEIRKNLSAEYQIDIFKMELKKYYEKNSAKWFDNCDFLNLDRKLDSHEKTLNPKWTNKTNDLKSTLSLYYFLNFILKKKNNLIVIIVIFFLEKILGLTKYLILKLR